MNLLTRAWLIVTTLVFSSNAYSAEAARLVWSGVDRIVAVGDIHGAYTELAGLLKAAGIVDADLRWSAGDTHFVSVGDLLDRGPDSKHVLDLLMALQPQAKAAGGVVHVLLGNHEIMNLTGDLRDASSAELDAHGGPAGHQQAFAASGIYGSWLLQQPSIIQINTTLFVHGGLSSITWNSSIDALNNGVADNLSMLLEQGVQLRARSLIPDQGDLLDPALIPTDERELFEPFITAASSSALGQYSLQWYRGNAACHPLIEAPRVDRALSGLNALRVVIGHTPTRAREVRTRFDGRVIMIDTGMLRSFYKGNPRALVIERTDTNDSLSVIGPTGGRQDIAAVDSAATNLTPTFVPMKQKQARRALAAHRLDRYLGLDMVPQTTEADKGVNLFLAPSLSEAARSAKQLIRPNYCEVGSAYDLLATFDALIGKFDRGPDNLHYNRQTWAIVAQENHLAFGNRPDVPQYSVPVKLAPRLKRALEALRAEDLYTLLDGLLTKREIRAILKRRDQIITWLPM
jgi:hypothetical protein